VSCREDGLSSRLHERRLGELMIETLPHDGAAQGSDGAQGMEPQSARKMNR